MSEDNEQKEINSKYDALKGVIGDAAKIKSDINSTCKEAMKSNKQDFSQFMLDNVDEDFKGVAERLGLFNGFADIEDKKKREKKMNASLKSFFGKTWKKCSDFEYTKKGGKPKENTPPKCDTYALDLIASLYVGSLIPEVKRSLDTAGIEIHFNKPITKLDLENNEDDKNTLMGYITRGANIQNEMFEKNAEIEDVIFENIPEDMKYDADTNPKGIKKSQFQALAELQSKTDEMSMDGDAEKATDIVEKQCDKHFTNSKNQEMLALVTELILAKNNEPAKPESWDEALGGTEDESNDDPIITAEEFFGEEQAKQEFPEDDWDEERYNTKLEAENLSKLIPEDMD